MIMFEELSIKTPEREILLDITSDIQNIVRKSGIGEGVCRIFVPHTTAAITINENADPSVMDDIINFLKKLIPRGGGFNYRFQHGEGNSDAHIKSSLIGPSLEVLIHNSRLVLGTWQGCFLAEFDGPRSRRIYIQVMGD
jgi:secondary thiamine-phosphate synthase enzyme